MSVCRCFHPLASRRGSRLFLVLLAVACGGAAVAGILVSRRDAAQAFNEASPRFASLGRLIPAYPDSRFFPMGESLAISGVEREMGYAVTLDSPRKVADRYEAIWQSQGFRVERRSSDDDEWVSASDLSDPWIRSILATAKGGRTTIVASVRDTWKAPEPPAVLIAEGCAVLSDDAATDRGVRTQELLLSCRAHLDEVLDYYDGALHGATRREHLGADGSADTAYITYSEVNREVRLMAKEGEPRSDGQPSTAVSITWQEGR